MVVLSAVPESQPGPRSPKGGVHMVMRVQTDAALRIETETTVERLRDAPQHRQRAVRQARSDGPTSFVAEGIQNDQAFRQAAIDVDTVFSRSSGTGSYTYTMRPNIEAQLREATVDAGAPDDRATGQRPRSGRAGCRAAWRRQPDPRAAARGDRRGPCAKEIIRSTALLELEDRGDGAISERRRGPAGV